jgi:hypothetical protein
MLIVNKDTKSAILMLGTGTRGELLMKTQFAIMTAALAFIAIPFAAQAQGVVRGANEGAYEGNRAAGPVGEVVGGVLGGAVGGAVGGVQGVVGIRHDHHRYHRDRFYDRDFRCDYRDYRCNYR